MTRTTYSVSLGHSAQQDDSAEAAEAAEAADAFDFWLDWLEEARDTIEESGRRSRRPRQSARGRPGARRRRRSGRCRPQGGTRRGGSARSSRIRTARSPPSCASSARRARRRRSKPRRSPHVSIGITDAIAAVTRENAELRTQLTACEQNLAQATAMLEKRSRASAPYAACSTPSAAVRIRSASPLSWPNGTPQRPWKS